MDWPGGFFPFRLYDLSMYYYAEQFQKLKGKPLAEKVRTRLSFYQSCRVVPRLYALAAIASIATVLLLAGLSFEAGLLAQDKAMGQLALTGSLLGGLFIYVVLYLIILNKFEYPRYMIFISGRQRLTLGSSIRHRVGRNEDSKRASIRRRCD